MPFDLELLKKHPYASGGVVIVGGIVLFLFMGKGGSSGGTVSAGSDAQLASIQASAQVQANQQAAQLQATQIQANVTNNQTQAAVDANDLSVKAGLISSIITTQAGLAANSDNNSTQLSMESNQLQYAQNVTQMQDNVLEAQINSGVLQNSDNNRTALAESGQGYDYASHVADLQARVATQGISAASDLAKQQESNYSTQVGYIEQHAGDKKNSALDATNQASIFQTILAHGNPNVAASGNYATSNAVVSGNSTGAASIINSISKLGAAVAGGFFG